MIFVVLGTNRSFPAHSLASQEKYNPQPRSMVHSAKSYEHFLDFPPFLIPLFFAVLNFPLLFLLPSLFFGVRLNLSHLLSFFDLITSVDFIAKLSSSWQAQCQSNWELRLVL